MCPLRSPGTEKGSKADFTNFGANRFVCPWTHYYQRGEYMLCQIGMVVDYITGQIYLPLF